MLATCLWTVRSPTIRLTAICRLLWLCATRPTTSRSWRVSGEQPLYRCWSRRRPARIRQHEQPLCPLVLPAHGYDQRVWVHESGRCSSIFASSSSMPRPGVSAGMMTPFWGTTGVFKNHWWITFHLIRYSWSGTSVAG